jgi:hypothetical protein
MIDLTQYSNSELSLNVFNDEGLYNIRHEPGFIEILDEVFIYTSEQLAELEQDLLDDAREQ